MPGSNHPLDGCNAKLQRAVEHLKALRAARDEFLKHPLHTVVQDTESEPGFVIQRIRIEDEAPLLKWAVLIGDTVHNQRCVLDYLAYELVRLNGGTPTTNTQFPIRDQAHQSGLSPSTQGMDPNHRMLIEGEQPYRGRHGTAADDPLARLRELSNQDKHRFPHLAYVIATPGTISVRPPGVLELVSSNPGPLENGAAVRRFRNLATMDTDVSIETEVELEIAFGQGGPCAGLRVVQTLADIGMRVTEIVQKFRPFFP